MKNEIIGQVSGGIDLTMEQMANAIGEIMSGDWEDNEIAMLLTALRAKGEAVAEIAGAAKAMRQKMTKINSKKTGLLDTCGTGGDGSGTFNISTAAAMVTAAAGVPVAKHGNRSITSKTGSADVLAALGVNIEASVEQCERCLNEIGICFCFAPLLHQSMKHVGPVRKKLGVPTIFNLLGPLCNPAAAEYQLLGVGKPEIRNKLAEALGMLGTKRAVVVTGADGLDELTITTTTHCTEITPDAQREFQWSPEDFGLTKTTDTSAMQVATPEQSAEVILSVLTGEPGPSRDIVTLNSAAALWTAGVDPSEKECLRRAAEAIDSGRAMDLLNQLKVISHA